MVTMPPPQGVQPGAAPGTSTYQSDQSLDPGRIATSAYGYGKDAASAAWNWLQPKPIDPLAPTKTYPGYFDPTVNRGLADQQQSNINDLSAAAAGKVASPAELQLQQQSGLNAARQFGLATALQGRNPGAALRSARLGSQATMADTNLQAAMLRAKEQAEARTALMEALARARQGEQQLYSTDTDYRKGMLDIGAKNAAADNTFKGGLINGGGGALGAIFSDRRVKTDVKPANLVQLAKAIPGYEFDYKDPAHGEGRRVGVMAQDVAAGGPIGERMVNMDGKGRLKLDVGNAVGAALAMSAQALREAKKPMVQLSKEG